MVLWGRKNYQDLLVNFRNATTKLKLCYCRGCCPEVFCKKDVLKSFVKFIGEHLCQGIFLKPITLLKKDTLAYAFSSEFCKIFKNNPFNRTPLVVVSNIAAILIKERALA